MIKTIKKLLKENFKFQMDEQEKPKDKKAPSPQDLRVEAWQKDTTIYTRERKGIWSAVGDVSEFIYRTGMTEEKAQEYAAELNRNKESY